MSHFILIHGAYMGSWCWEDTAARLIRAGHWAVAPDLPSQGRDPTPVASVTLESYVSTVVRLIDAACEPVVLVGHSLGGLTTAMASERRPDKIKTAVYLAAFMLPNGASPRGLYEELAEPSPVMASSILHDDGSATLKPDGIKDFIFNMSPDAVAEEAKRHLRPTPRKPMATPLELTPGNFGRVRRIYIEALHDKAIPNRLQKLMVQRTGCERVITFDSDHTPMFSKPNELERALLALA